MIKVFLDTNILMDFIESRPGAVDAANVLRYANAGTIYLAASTLTFANMAYIIGRKRSQQEVCQVLGQLRKVVNIVALEPLHVNKAIDLPCKDFEDMLQYQCAVSNQFNIIVTNNKKDFVEFSKLPLFTAAELINELK